MPKKVYFSPDMFKFLKDLKANNNREWFHANKEIYESAVRNPMLMFISDFRDRLHKISPYFKVDPRPAGGSMFRIHRDTRFARDKSPYKINVGAHFPHNDCGKDVHAPGFYLHIEPGNCMGGGGLWHPDAITLKKVRERIANKTKDWKMVINKGIIIEGEMLKRLPQGYDPEHQFIEDLKRKDFYVMTGFTEQEVCSSDFMDTYLECCRKAAPLTEFLTRAVGLSW